MTTPISFDPLPVPVRKGLVDLATPAKAQASTLDANFAKIGSAADTIRAAQSWTQRQLLYSPVVFGAGGPYTWDPVYWPPLTFTVPTGCAALFFWSELAVWCRDGLFLFIPTVTGGGVSADWAGSTWSDPLRQDFATAGQKFVMGGVSRFTDKVHPGGTVTITPRYYTQFGTGPYGSNSISSNDGAFGAVAVMG